MVVKQTHPLGGSARFRVHARADVSFSDDNKNADGGGGGGDYVPAQREVQTVGFRGLFGTSEGF